MGLAGGKAKRDRSLRGLFPCHRPHGRSSLCAKAALERWKRIALAAAKHAAGPDGDEGEPRRFHFDEAGMLSLPMDSR